MKFLFLYTEIAEYFLACCKKLTEHGDIHIIRWPVNKEAPFEFNDIKNITLYSKTDYDFNELQKLVATINPDVIVCSGWIDKDYLKITNNYFGKIPTIMTCDTHWRGSLKQYVATVISRFTLLNIFSHAWVPGDIQMQYALKLGFKKEKIGTGFYSCDVDFFESIYQNQKAQKEKELPKRFLYVGRYYDFKGITELWNAFIELQKDQPNEWELWCLGVGDIKPVQHPKIKHFGFVQPKDIANYTKDTSVFILPSRFEPWGVVVHEFATCGFPLLLSDVVGAKQFLKEGENGFEFINGNTQSIKNALEKMAQKSDQEIVNMGNLSNQISKTISPDKWIDTLLSFKL